MSTEISKIQNLIQDELQLVERMLTNKNQSTVDLANSVSSHLIQSAGKRLRPMLVIFSALAVGYDNAENIHLDLNRDEQFVSILSCFLWLANTRLSRAAHTICLFPSVTKMGWCEVMFESGPTGLALKGALGLLRSSECQT